MGADAGISRATAQRLVRLTELIPPLLDMVDGKKLPLKSAEHISYLDAEQQRMVFDAIQGEETPLSASQSETIKKSGQEGRLDAAVIQEALAAEKSAVKSVVLKKDRLQRFFPSSYTPKQIEEVIFRLLESWHEHENQ